MKSSPYRRSWGDDFTPIWPKLQFCQGTRHEIISPGTQNHLPGGDDFEEIIYHLPLRSTLHLGFSNLTGAAACAAVAACCGAAATPAPPRPPRAGEEAAEAGATPTATELFELEEDSFSDLMA